MPWHIGKSSECPASKPYAVIKDSDQSVAGCHATRAEAEAQMRALYASEHATIGGIMTVTADPEAPVTLYWSGPLAMEDAPTGDGRRVMADALTWRDLPLPLMFQRQTPEGNGNPHAGASLAGRITALWRDGDTVYGAGTIDTGSDGADLARFLEDGPLGVSVDLDDVTSAVECLEEDADGQCIDGELQLVKGRVMGATATPFPALPNAQIGLVSAEEYAALTSEHTEALAVVEPHDFVDSGDGTCKVCGLTQAEHNAAQAQAISAAAYRIGRGFASAMERESRHDLREMARNVIAADPLTAGGGPMLPPEAWFEDPDLSGVTPLTITDEGRVYGHAARWGQPHIALAGRTAPRSGSGYAYFRTGARRAECDCPEQGGQAEVPTGTITLGTSHLRDLSAGSREALDHYEHTGLAVADVAAGEDEYGIWVAGALRPDVSDERIVELRGASLSGDWRWIGGRLELVAVLAVNVPGFPIPRPMAHTQEGRETALVAAGIVAPQHPASMLAVSALESRIGVLEDRLARQSVALDALRPLALEALGQRFIQEA